MSQLATNAFVRKDDTIEFDYSLEPLIEEFNKDGIYALLNSSSSRETENGAYLAITGKQYILALNNKFGKGTHILAAGRILSELTGKSLDAKNVFPMCKELEGASSIITARLFYEYLYTDAYGRPLYNGKILFGFGNNKFNKNVIDTFLQFYDDYNSQIKSVCKKYDIEVILSYDDKNGNFDILRGKDLEKIKDYILSHRDDTVKDYFEENNIEEKIIGTIRKEDTFKR